MGDRLATIDMGEKLEGLYPFGGRGAGSPSNTMWPGLRHTSISSGIWIYPAVWPYLTWAENWGLCPFCGGGQSWSASSTMSPGPRPTSIPNAILIHPAVWPQRTWVEDWGGAVPLLGELGPHLTQCGRSGGQPPRQVSSWSIQLFGHNTPTSQTDRIDRQDRQYSCPIAQSKQFYKRSPKNFMLKNSKCPPQASLLGICSLLCHTSIAPLIMCHRRAVISNNCCFISSVLLISVCWLLPKQIMKKNWQITKKISIIWAVMLSKIKIHQKSEYAFDQMYPA